MIDGVVNQDNIYLAQVNVEGFLFVIAAVFDGHGLLGEVIYVIYDVSDLLYVCMYVYLYTFIFSHARTYTRIYTRTRAHAHTHMHIHTHLHICTYIAFPDAPFIQIASLCAVEALREIAEHNPVLMVGLYNVLFSSLLFSSLLFFALLFSSL